MEKIENFSNKQSNQLSATIKELFELLQSEKNNFKEEKNSYGLTRIIIPENIVDKIKNTLNTQKLTDNQKELLKKLIKKSLILHNQSAIVFGKGKIFIIPKKVDEKRFHGLAPEDIEFILHEFLKGFNTNYIIQEVINNIDFSTYNSEQIKNFIEGEYKKTILNTYKKVLKSLIKSDINEEILEGIAGKLFRENFEKTVKKVVEKLITKLTITQKEQIIQDITEKILAEFDFNNPNINFFQINENLTKNIFQQVKEKINYIIQHKTNAKINKEWMDNDYIIQITKDILQKIFQKLTENIFTLLEQNPSDTQIYKSLDNFFSYYSGKIEIKGMKKIQYPKLEISHINKGEEYQNRFESYSYKYILNQLITYIKKKKQLEKELRIINNKIKNLIESQTQLTEEKKQIEIQLNKARGDLKSLNQKISQLNSQKEKIQKELDKISQEEKKSGLNKLKTIFSTDKSRLKEDLQKLNKELNSTKIQKQDLSRKISNLETKIDSLKTNITNLKKLENQKKFYEEQLTKIQEILQDIQKDLTNQLPNRKQSIN